MCASKIEAVCCEIETHSGSSLSARFTEKIVGAIPRFMCPKTKLLAVEFRHILEVLCLQVLQKKLWAQFPICASNNEAVCCEVQTHSVISLPASFSESVLGTIPGFVRPKTKLFALKFRRILEVLCLQVLKNMLWAQFHNFFVQE